MGQLPLTAVLLAEVQAREPPLRPLHAVQLHMQPPLLLVGVLLATVQTVPLHGCDDVVELSERKYSDSTIHYNTVLSSSELYYCTVLYCTTFATFGTSSIFNLYIHLKSNYHKFAFFNDQNHTNTSGDNKILDINVIL